MQRVGSKTRGTGSAESKPLLVAGLAVKDRGWSSIFFGESIGGWGRFPSKKINGVGKYGGLQIRNTGSNSAEYGGGAFSGGAADRDGGCKER